MTPNGLGALYVVATPIGNAGDLSPRALEALRTADVIFAEDTRSAHALLTSSGIDRQTRSCFDANEATRASEAAALFNEGKNVALLSEAGTPAISDPGFRLIRAAIDLGARVIPIPGPSAVLAALVASGLPTDRFFFAGFPPRRPGARRALFESLANLPATLVFYESPHRVAAALADMVATLGPERPACVARELTKTHEEIIRAPLGELARRYVDQRPLGEVTLVVGGAPGATEEAPDEDALRTRAAALLAEGLSARDAADRLAIETNLPRRDVYQIVVALKQQPSVDE